MGWIFWARFYCFKGNLIGFNHKTEYRCESSSAMSPGNIAERESVPFTSQLTLSDAPALLPAGRLRRPQARKDNSSRRLTATLLILRLLLATTLNRVTADGVSSFASMPVDARPGRYNRSWKHPALALFISVELFLHDVLRFQKQIEMSVLSCISPRLASSSRFSINAWFPAKR